MSSKLKLIFFYIISTLSFLAVQHSRYEMHCFEGLKDNNKRASSELRKMSCPQTSFSMQQIDENSFIPQNDKIIFRVICFQRIFLSG